VWGLALSTRALGKNPRPAWLFDLHRFLGGLALIFTAVHVGAVLLDTYVHFSLVNVLVPFTGTWHPVAVAWGIVAMYLLLAVEMTSLLRKHISKRLWCRVHFGSFALFAFSTVHGLTAGTDRSSGLLVVAMLWSKLVTACQDDADLPEHSLQSVSARNPGGIPRRLVPPARACLRSPCS